MCRSLLVALLVIAITIPGQAQKYKKKIVSYVDKVLVPSQYSLTAEQTELIKRSVANSINFARFNYASLPDTVIRAFSTEASTLTQFAPDSVKPVLDKTLAPQLLQIIDMKKEILSKQNLSEADRNSFLATKAMAAGMSASQFESILNSGFFYIPFVEHYERTVKKGARQDINSRQQVATTIYSHKLKLGLLWYKLNVDSLNSVSVVSIGRAQGWGLGSMERSKEKDDDEEGNPDGDAFLDVVNTSCKNIIVETKRIDAFSLTAGVTETTVTGLRLSAGNREGVGLDDTYWIEELEETEAGQIIKTKRGFVKIREVADNKKDESSSSYAQVITGSNYSLGLSAVELPMLGINALIAGVTFPASVSEFNSKSTLPPMNLLGSSNYNFGIKVNAENKNAYGLILEGQTSLAHLTKVSELWGHVGFIVGWTNVDGKLYVPKFNSSQAIDGTDSVDIGISWTGAIYAGVQKKFYFRRFGFLLQADIKYGLFSMEGKGKDVTNSDDVTYTLGNSTLGFDVRAGLEVYVTPTLSVGAAAEYNVYGTNNSWSAKVDGKDGNELVKNKDAVGPDIKYSGVGIYVWVNFAIPSF